MILIEEVTNIFVYEQNRFVLRVSDQDVFWNEYVLGTLVSTSEIYYKHIYYTEKQVEKGRVVLFMVVCNYYGANKTMKTILYWYLVRRSIKLFY